jgi:hypothetical protein
VPIYAPLSSVHLVQNPDGSDAGAGVGAVIASHISKSGTRISKSGNDMVCGGAILETVRTRGVVKI